MDDIFASLNYTMEPGKTGIKILYPDYENTYTIGYRIVPGITLFLQHMQTRLMPFTVQDSFDLIIINYGIHGRSEQTLTDGNLTYVSSGDLALSTLTTQNGSRFPNGHYEGVELSIDLDEFHKSGALMSMPWGPDVNRLKDLCGKNQFFEAHHVPYIDNLMQQIWNVRRDDSLNEYAKLCIWVQDLLRYLIYEEIPEKEVENLSRTQADYALEYESILTSHIGEHISAKAVAEKFHISETSLKNYFQIEFGESVSSYMKKYRMKKARELLLSRGTIAEIAEHVGYANPSKFAAAFRSHYGMSPFQFRRDHKKED